MKRKFLLLSILSPVTSEFLSEDSQETEVYLLRFFILQKILQIFKEAKNISPENQIQSVSLRDQIPVHLAQPRPMGPQNLGNGDNMTKKIKNLHEFGGFYENFDHFWDQNAMLGLFKNVFDFISDFNVDCGNTECYQPGILKKI